MVIDMPNLSSITRLSQLVLLLSSDQPGEVVAAAGAIGRTLKEVGLTWHDLAASLTSPAPPPPPQPRSPAPAPSAPSAARLRRDCDYLTQHAPLTGWERGFVASISASLRAGRRLSPRQLSTLREIYAERAGSAL